MLDASAIREQLRAFDFKSLFNELGWDHHEAHHNVTADGETYAISAIAHKRGVQILQCDPDSSGKIPDYLIRRKIDKQVTKFAHEHLIIFVNAAKTEQVWQWVSKEPGHPTRYHQHRYHAGLSGEALLQKLNYLTFPLSAEESLTISGVTVRLRDAFQRERVTRRFYDRFKDEHKAFLKFLNGIPDQEMNRWYVSVMINRLMFIYFVQYKGFLDSDNEYLKNKLAQIKKQGKDLFYKEFLCPLFFEGFAKKASERSAVTNKLLGKIPYFNGGLFLKHQIEELHGRQIQIADRAFERLFDFFGEWNWHLDERPLRDDDEINPDVLGYIFEKYINQKQMGAYYTKEDITEYICKNTIIPFLFDRAREKCRIAFEGEHSVWQLLQRDPDRYIYKAVRHGVTWDIHEDKPLDKPYELPKEIAVGLNTTTANLIERRKAWNNPAPPECALPTEIWREVVARRSWYQEIRAKLAAGEVQDINDLVTYNLDIRQFAQDVIENCEGPDLLNALWRTTEKVTVLDPACGSGAFLFAALNILEPLYEACLERMDIFLDEWAENGKRLHPNYHKLFNGIRNRIEQHPNQRYFTLKSIIINNLFGVDVMEEATEICKLRLFLKLVAQVERDEQIEPLPDIDFNIRAGNSLVGYATYDHVKAAVTIEDTGQDKMQFDDAMTRIEEKAHEVDRQFALFRQQQTELGGEVTVADKKELRRNLSELEDELNDHLSTEYGVKSIQSKQYRSWLHSHRPFHWFVEFHNLMRSGGFDVVVGNPPYVEYKDVRNKYQVKGYSTMECENLYAYMWERSLVITRDCGRVGLIIPVSSVSTGAYSSLRKLWLSRGSLIISNFNDRPGKLFEGLEHVRLSIVLLEKRRTAPQIHTTVYNKWSSEAREYLFPLLTFTKATTAIRDVDIPKIGSALGGSVLTKLSQSPKTLQHFVSNLGQHEIFYTRKLSSFVQILNFVPSIRDQSGRKRNPSELKTVTFPSAYLRDIFLCALNSSLFYWYLTVWSDCRNLNKREVIGFPLTPTNDQVDNTFTELAKTLMSDFQKHSKLLQLNYKDWGRMEIQCIYPKYSKPIIDKIEKLLAENYGFNEEELDFIINYDIKYRMGLTGENDEED